MGTEDEPYEGDIPIDKVEDGILEIVSQDRSANKKYCYIFDSWEHKSADEFLQNISREFGLPNFCIHTVAEKKTIEDRFKKANEVDDVGEDAQAELAEAATKDDENQAQFDQFEDINKKCHTVSTETMEGAAKTLREIFSAKILLVNHEKRLDVDTVCSNLAIKYNFLYLSVHQLIREHIQNKTAVGQALLASKKPKALNDSARLAEGAEDEYEEAEYSAAHWDQKTLLKIIADTLVEKRTNQQFILLEGLCNNRKLENEADKLATRHMDELLAIEKCLGEIQGVVSLQYQLEKINFECDKFEEFEEPVVEKKAAEPQLDDDGQPIDAPPADDAPVDDGEPKAPVFNPADFKWTATNGISHNLPQVFKDLKGLNVEDL